MTPGCAVRSVATMHKLSSLTIAVAALGGALWVVKTAVITATDGSFGTLESVCFVGGLLLIVLACVLAAWDLAGRKTPLGVAAAAGTAIGLFALTSLVLAAGQSGVAAIAPGDNLGLEEEGGVFLAGALWLALAIAATAPRRLSPRAALA